MLVAITMVIITNALLHSAPMICVSHLLLRNPLSVLSALLNPLLLSSNGSLPLISSHRVVNISGGLQDCVLKPEFSKVGYESTGM